MGAEILFPRLMNVMSQDNLLDTKQINLLGGDLSVMRDETFSVTDNRATAVDTFPQTKSGPSETAAGEGVNRNLSMAESMLQQS